MARGRFITLEGGEGAGKSTHAARLVEFLGRHGCNAIATREPGGSAGAEEIRRLLVSGAADRWSPLAELLLMNAARDEHLRQVVRPALDAGTWVVCDRFADSSRAYQGIVGGVSPDVVAAIERAVVGETVPDLTLVFDLDVDTGLARARGRSSGGATDSSEDRFERKGRAFHAALRQAFLDIAAAEPVRCVVIDAARTLDEVAEQARSIVWQRLMEPSGMRHGQEGPTGG